jgi:glycosyltransferase involved in cell wall biosynthesis
MTDVDCPPEGSRATSHAAALPSLHALPHGAARSRGLGGDGEALELALPAPAATDTAPLELRPGTAAGKPTVALVAACPFAWPQGSQILIDELAHRLGLAGHEVHVVAYHLGNQPRPARAYHLHRVPALSSYRKTSSGPSLKKPIVDALLAVTLARVVKRHRVEVVHAHSFEAAIAGYLVRALHGVPVVYHGHTGLADELPTYFEGRVARHLARVLGRVVDRTVPRHADAAIAVSRDMVDLLQAGGVDPERIELVPPGLDYPRFEPCERQMLERRHGLPPGPKVVFAGNLCRYQNLPVLWRAFAAVRRARPDVHLVVASHDPEVTSTSGYEGLPPGSVTPIRDGNFERMRELLAISDVAVSLSAMQFGFPIKLLNYMAAGKAIVAAAPSAKGLEHLETALLVPPHDAEAVAAGVVRLLDDGELRARLGARARDHFEREHLWPPLVDRLAAVYERVLGR